MYVHGAPYKGWTCVYKCISITFHIETHQRYIEMKMFFQRLFASVHVIICQIGYYIMIVYNNNITIWHIRQIFIFVCARPYCFPYLMSIGWAGWIAYSFKSVIVSLCFVLQGILERLAEGPVIGDGGFVFALEKRGYVKAGPWTPEASVEHPEAGMFTSYY